MMHTQDVHIQGLSEWLQRLHSINKGGIKTEKPARRHVVDFEYLEFMLRLPFSALTDVRGAVCNL